MIENLPLSFHTETVSRALEMRPEIYRYLSARVGNPTDAEDLVQDTYLRVLESAQKYDPEKAPLGSWVKRIAHNLWVDDLRRKARRPTTELAEDCATFDPIEEIDDKLDAQTTLYRVEPVLNDGERQVLALKAQNKTFEEVASELRIPVGTAKGRAWQGRKKALKVAAVLQ